MLKSINSVKYLNSIVINENMLYIEQFMDELKSLEVHRFNYWNSSSMNC